MLQMSAIAWIDDLKSAEGFQAALITHAPKAVAGVLLALIAIELGLTLTAQPGQAVSTGAVPVPVPTRAPNRTLELATVLNAHLFGQASAAPIDGADAPQTTIPLVLAGVLAMPNPREGMAILGENATSARLYKIGDAVPGNAALHSVYADRVLLERNGAVEALFLPKTLSSSNPVAPPRSATPVQRLQNLAQNNQLLGGVMRVQPVLNQNKLTGYRIFPGAPGTASIFSELGLQSGDLITAINGTALDDPNRGAELLQTLSTAGSATVTVSRNGQLTEVNLNLETVAARAEAATAAAEAAAPARGRNALAPGGAPQAGFGGRRGGGGANGNGNGGRQQRSRADQ